MSSYLELRHQTWHATLTIPADLRDIIGKRRFFKSLKTSSKREASTLVFQVVADWKAMIERARAAVKSGETFTLEAEAWKSEIDGATDEDAAETLKILLVERAEEIEAKRGLEVAKEFVDSALGKRTPLSTHFESWKAQLVCTARTRSQMVKDVSKFIERFPTLQGVTKASVKGWTQEMTQEGASAHTVKRILSFCKNYWGYLKELDVVRTESNPFTGILSTAQTKGLGKVTRKPFKVSEVPALWQAAEAKGDAVLAVLIKIGAYTGARIEELCQLSVNDVQEDGLHIRKSKTDAGVRIVPIHPAIRSTIDELASKSTDSFLIPGLSVSKYGERSTAIGKRFGNLKKKLGHGDDLVFHSLRKTVATMLENVGVSENVAADILGHEKPRMTYGLYSGGASPATMLAAISLVDYPLGSSA